MSGHPTYSEMVLEAVSNLKSRTGSSRQAISKYLSDNFDLPDRYEVHMKLALKRLVDQKVLTQTSGTGASGSFMLNKSKSRSTKKTAEDAEHLKGNPDIKEPLTKDVTKKKSVTEKVMDDGDERDAAVKPRRGRGGEASVGESDEKGESKTDVKPKRGKRGVAKDAKKDEAVLSKDPVSVEDEVATKLKAAVQRGKGGKGTAKRSDPPMDSGMDTLSDAEIGEGHINTRRGKGRATKKPPILDEVKESEIAVERKRGGRGKPGIKKLVDVNDDAPSDEVGEGEIAVQPKRGGRGKAGKGKKLVDSDENKSEIAVKLKMKGGRGESETAGAAAKGLGDASEDALSSEEGTEDEDAEREGGANGVDPRGKMITAKHSTDPLIVHSLGYQDVTGGRATVAQPRRGGRGKVVKKPVDADESTRSGEEESESETVTKTREDKRKVKSKKVDVSEDTLSDESGSEDARITEVLTTGYHGEIGPAKSEEVSKGAAKAKKGKVAARGAKKGDMAEEEKVGVKGDGEPAAKPRRKGVKGGEKKGAERPTSEATLLCDEEVQSEEGCEAAAKPRGVGTPVTKDAKTGEILKAGETDKAESGVVEEDPATGKAKRGTKQNTSNPRAKRARK